MKNSKKMSSYSFPHLEHHRRRSEVRDQVTLLTTSVDKRFLRLQSDPFQIRRVLCSLRRAQKLHRVIRSSECDCNSRELDYNILNEHIAIVSTERIRFQEGLRHRHLLHLGTRHRHPEIADPIRQGIPSRHKHPLHSHADCGINDSHVCRS